MASRSVALAIAVLCLAGAAACSGSSPDATSPANGSNRAPFPPGGVAAPSPGRTGTSVQGEMSTDDQSVSTFALDVDTASYTFARSQLLAGRRPGANEIRPEEFVNAFHQN